jgi:hypothetical protein
MLDLRFSEHLSSELQRRVIWRISDILEENITSILRSKSEASKKLEEVCKEQRQFGNLLASLMEAIFTRYNENSQNFLALQPRIPTFLHIVCLHFSNAVLGQQTKKSYGIKTVQ